MESKIRIKMGAIELDYEGSEHFLKEELPELLEAVVTLYKEAGGGGALPELPGESQRSNGASGISAEIATSTIVAKLKGDAGGPKLVLAATAKMTFAGEGDGPFARGDILQEMKAATSYYKKTYSNNLSTYLKNLVKQGKLTEHGGKMFALSAEARTAIEAAFA